MESKIIIRKGVAGDAEQIIQHTKTVLQENPFVMGTFPYQLKRSENGSIVTMKKVCCSLLRQKAKLSGS